MNLFEIIYLCGMAVIWVVRLPYAWAGRGTRAAERRAMRPEWLQFTLISLTMVGLPAIFIFTPWLAFADYRLPAWAGWGGVPIFAAALLLFWRSHADLGRSWSPAVIIKPDHHLVTVGIYRHIRHPMYAAFWLWGIAQPLLLWNGLAGWGFLPAFALMYFLRVPHEERLLLEHFGVAYRDYMARTGRVWPRFRHHNRIMVK